MPPVHSGGDPHSAHLSYSMYRNTIWLPNGYNITYIVMRYEEENSRRAPKEKSDWRLVTAGHHAGPGFAPLRKADSSAGTPRGSWRAGPGSARGALPGFQPQQSQTAHELGQGLVPDFTALGLGGRGRIGDFAALGSVQLREVAVVRTVQASAEVMVAVRTGHFLLLFGVQ